MSTTEAAKRAWETMRERYTEEEISERQREAAHKAWETRRARAQARSNAAKKAWKTRRKKG